MAKAIRFTVKALDGLKASTGSKNETIRDTDCKGLTAVRYAKSGDVSFVFSGRVKGGKKRDVTLGRYPSLSISEARNRALEMMRLYRDGIDPVEQAADAKREKETKAALDAALQVTLREVFERQLVARQNKPSTIRDKRSTFDVCFGDWMDKPIRSITRQMVEDRYTKQAFKEGKKPQAAKAMRYLSSVMNYAKAEEISVDGGETVRLVERNPVDVLSDKKIDRTVKPRKDALDANQIAQLLDHLMHCEHPQYDGPHTSDTLAGYLLLLLFTGIRRGEAASLRWEDVDLDSKTFTLHDTKNGEDFVVPMSGMVERMLKGRFERRNADNPWVFPAHRGGGHLVEPSKAIQKINDHLGIKFSSHTLRHTFATFAYSEGIDWDRIKGMLNHKKGDDITARYVHKNAEMLRPHFDMVMNGMMVEYQGYPEDGEWAV